MDYIRKNEYTKQKIIEMEKSMSLLLTHGNILTMDGYTVENGDLLIENGIISAISPHIPNRDCRDISVWDVSNLLIMPGLVESHCHIGISEERKGTEGDDCNETTTPITPTLRGLDAINPMDSAFHKAIQAGITSVMVGPGSSNVVGGQFVFMKTGGSRKIDDLVVKQPAAMKVAFGENPKTQYGGQNVMPCSRMAIASLLREELFKAQSYYKEYKDSLTSQKPFKEDFSLSCWIPVFEKKIPLKCHAHRTDDIFTAIRIAKEFDLDITIDHCTEGHLITEELKEAGFPAIVGPDFTSRSKIEVENMAFKTAGILSRTGILTSITTDHPVSVIQSLPLCAGMAVKNGMDETDALKAITINAAKICRVDNRVGSLVIGKDADIAIFDGSPLLLSTKCIGTIIDGKIVYRMKDAPV